jgi:2-oxoglutarate dehydrogenase E1 component
VLLDQFIASGQAKWRQTSSLVLLLPHGYEGQGPEHSSARLERFLQLAANGSLRIANCTTSAQYFHLLRRQAKLLNDEPRPLVVMTPKSLLRHPLAGASLAELSEGGFQTVIDDMRVQPEQRERVTRLVLCSGKVYVDLAASPEREATPEVAVVRVEELYPFPEEALRAVIAGYPSLAELTWLQEEPRNMGAWTYIAPLLRELAPELPLSYVGRPERASPAEGSSDAHAVEQARIVAAAFSGTRALQLHGSGG